MTLRTKKVLAKWQRNADRNSATQSKWQVSKKFRTRSATRFRCDATTGGHVGCRYHSCLNGRKTIGPS